MKTTAGLTLVIGAWFLLVTAPAAAHDEPHREAFSRGYVDVHYDYRVGRPHAMPRWLKRHKGFRHWYRDSRYQYNRRIGWSGLWDIYSWERRHARRYERGFDGYDRRRGGKHKHRHKRHH